MRKIIHIDADAFYASIEERDNPSLRQLPIAVGGAPGNRGVVATCNYIARQYGVHSAMASSRALALCPSLVFIKPRFDVYREASQRMHAIFKQYTQVIEPLSLDEAYLDVTACEQHQGSATRIAKAIQQEVRNTLGFTVSAGVAPNKFLAKVASDWRKPAGIHVIAPDTIDDFVKGLPVKKINGVGKVTERKLAALGIHTCLDLQQVPLSTLEENFGTYGKRLSEVAFGLDERPVVTKRNRKSLSVEHTFETDLDTNDQLHLQCERQYAELIERSKKLKPEQTVSGRVVKIKFNDFSQTTLEEAIPIGFEDWRNLSAFKAMIISAWQRKQRPVRLIGLGLRISNNKTDKHQLDLFL